MSKKLRKSTKFSPNPLKVEVIHLSLNNSNNNIINNNNENESESEAIAKDLKQKLRKADYKILNVKLDLFKLEESPNARTFYEDDRVYRFNGSIDTESNDILGVKKILANICAEEKLCNTLFSLNFETIEWLSKIDRLIPHQTFKLNAFSFGTLIDLTQFVDHYNSHRNRNELKLNVAKDDITADFQHDKNRLLLKFRLTSGGINGKYMKNIRYKLEYEYSSINSAVVFLEDKTKDKNTGTKDNVMRIYFSLNHPPLLFKVQSDHESTQEVFSGFNKSNFQNKSKYKQKDYKIKENTSGVHTNEISNSAFWLRDNEFNGCEPETIGKSNVIMIEIKQIENEENLKDRYRELPDPWRLLYIMKRFLQLQIHFANIKHHESVDNNNINKLIDSIDVPFRIKYAYHSVFSHTFQASDELFLKKESNYFNQKVIEFAKIDSEAIEGTLFEISQLINRSAIFRTNYALDYIFNESKTRNEKLIGQKLTKKLFNAEIELIRKCILTPTRFLLLPPQPTLKSRFIVESDSSYTIRLSVREDDMQGLCYSIRTSSSKESQSRFLKKVIKEPLMKGIKIGDRLFEFLGSSSSQLKDSGMVLYAKDESGRTASLIRESIGDMSEIRRNVAKYVARLGLAFSQVMTHIDIDIDRDVIDYIEDIEREGYCFSDGVGMISKELVEKVYEKLKIECKNKPSAMQIRFGGCKGMLAINPNLNGKQIIFRKSMKKYDSDNKLLGILKLSAPRPLYLNRPFITILEQLGVEPKDFLFRLMENLKNLANSLICECSATSILQDSCTLGIPYRKLYKSGIPFLSEPIFRQIVDCVIQHRINELRLKARIKLPMNCGRTVFGVFDETNTLNYGEVFVRLSLVDEDGMPEEYDCEISSGVSKCKCFILEGEIMVTKFPCLHPGDVRKFKAVDIPKLHHIKDCIVFPAKGQRPHPNEMAGSDLDGDEYAVVWSSDLIFKGENRKAMDFPASDPKILPKDAEVGDILDFYCDYIISNNVGLIASAHLANADLEEKGIFSDKCMSLAKKHAVALDFAKTGTVEAIQWSERPKIYPDFMEKFSTKRTYLSNNVLGQLYRHCDRYGTGMQSRADLEITAEPNAIFKLEGWEKYEKSATDAFESYKEKISFLLNRFGVDSEAALLSGAFSKTSKYMTGRQESYDVHELLENMINKLFIDFKDRFNEECSNCSDKERRLRASAWYMIPFKLNKQLKDKYFGFAWTITDEFCKLFQDCNQQKDSKGHVCVRYSTALLDDYFQRNFIYKEPVFDESITSEGDKRQKIMEERSKTAEVVLKAWLERQDHLFFKRKMGRKLVSSTDGLMSDMDRKLRRKLMKMRVDVMFEARNNLNEPLRSAGNLVMSFMKESIEEWLSMSSLQDNNRIVDTPLVKFGFSALITLNHFFKTRQISHIINLSSKFEVSLKAPIKDSTFYIALPDDQKYKSYVEYIVQNNEQFIDKMRRLSGAIEITLEPYPISSKKLSHYYLLTASGTVWSLQAIKNFIAHKSFFKIVANDKNWRKKNMWCRGMPDWRTNGQTNSSQVVSNR